MGEEADGDASQMKKLGGYIPGIDSSILEFQNASGRSVSF